MLLGDLAHLGFHAEQIIKRHINPLILPSVSIDAVWTNHKHFYEGIRAGTKSIVAGMQDNECLWQAPSQRRRHTENRLSVVQNQL